ncbi:cytochrome c peroxidase [Vibrio sp. 10N.286.49.B3]|uniref:cytochrome-c peroxidase n=1 Tax=Vibrio sp. 10N.286.49.B3 TaxID=1880855 RepID=UPI001F52E267|nr:cytochrome c peroxidase [Vibrio sp. 10N.286.49.B3]
MFSSFLYFSYQSTTLGSTALVSNPKISTDSLPIFPVPESPTHDIAMVKLGFQLFNDPNLSSNGQVSCESCHHIFEDGAEETKVSIGVLGVGARNSPTLYNINFNSRFFWDGRAASLEQQIDGPIHNPVEMNSDWEKIITYVKDQPNYQRDFKALFKQGVSEESIKHALVIFMEMLNTPNSPFDQYLQGDINALSTTAIIGWNKFQSLGCIVCHQGINMGGNLYQRFGNLHSGNMLEKELDLGRFNVTGNEADKLVFRVAGLRNVADTPPYFHDGRAATLEEAIVTMANLQLGIDLDSASIIEVSAFLESLSAPKPAILSELSQ